MWKRTVTSLTLFNPAGEIVSSNFFGQSFSFKQLVFGKWTPHGVVLTVCNTSRICLLNDEISLQSPIVSGPSNRSITFRWNELKGPITVYFHNAFSLAIQPVDQIHPVLGKLPILVLATLALHSVLFLALKLPQSVRVHRSSTSAVIEAVGLKAQSFANLRSDSGKIRRLTGHSLHPTQPSNSLLDQWRVGSDVPKRVDKNLPSDQPAEDHDDLALRKQSSFEIARMMNKKRNEILLCLEKYKKVDLGKIPALDAEFDINAHGRISAVSFATNGFHSNDFASCIQDALQEFHGPQLHKNMKIAQTFIFQ